MSMAIACSIGVQMIYFDNAATTQMDKICLEAYQQYGVDNFYNPSALYSKSLQVSNCIKSARNIIAKTIGATKEEIVFTASGSEADNLALLCSIKSKKGKVIISNVEHSAVYNTAQELSRRGYEVVFAPCDRYGRVDQNAFEQLVDDSVVLVSIMHVCNETGALNDIKTLCKILKAKSPYALFHCDGVQAYGKIPVNVKTLGIDMYSASGHKIHGPKGIGFLYVKKGIVLRPIIFGGGQENNIRSATENVASIMALAMVVEKNFSSLKSNAEHIKSLQLYAYDQLSSSFEDIRFNTDLEHSIGNILSFAIKGVRGEVVTHCMEEKGIIVGTGSACSARKSHHRIPQALGIDNAYAEGMLRVSWNENNTKQEIDQFVSALIQVVATLQEYQRK